MVRLDIGTGAADCPAAGLDNALEIVRGNATSAEDVSVGEVSEGYRKHGITVGGR